MTPPRSIPDYTKCDAHATIQLSRPNEMYWLKFRCQRLPGHSGKHGGTLDENGTQREIEWKNKELMRCGCCDRDVGLRDWDYQYGFCADCANEWSLGDFYYKSDGSMSEFKCDHGAARRNRWPIDRQ